MEWFANSPATRSPIAASTDPGTRAGWLEPLPRLDGQTDVVDGRPRHVRVDLCDDQATGGPRLFTGAAVAGSLLSSRLSRRVRGPLLQRGFGLFVLGVAALVAAHTLAT